MPKRKAKKQVSTRSSVFARSSLSRALISCALSALGDGKLLLFDISRVDLYSPCAPLMSSCILSDSPWCSYYSCYMYAHNTRPHITFQLHIMQSTYLCTFPLLLLTKSVQWTGVHILSYRYRCGGRMAGKSPLTSNDGKMQHSLSIA